MTDNEVRISYQDVIHLSDELESNEMWAVVACAKPGVFITYFSATTRIDEVTCSDCKKTWQYIEQAIEEQE